MKSCNGIAILETALCLILLLTLFLAGASVFDYVHKSMFISHVVDEYLFDQSIQALSLSGSTTVVNEDKIQSGLTQIVEQLRTNLERSLEDSGLSTNQYLIEGDFASISIDPEDGRALGLRMFANSQVQAGALAVSEDLKARADLEGSFEKMASESAIPSPYAIPTGALGDSAARQYLTDSVLIGVRAFYSIEGSFSSSLMELLGFESGSVLYDVKVVNLRGEIG